MTHIKYIALALVAAATLAGCSDNLGDLEAKVTEIKARPGGRIEPLPEVKPYETFTYAAATSASAMCLMWVIWFRSLDATPSCPGHFFLRFLVAAAFSCDWLASSSSSR